MECQDSGEVLEPDPEMLVGQVHPGEGKLLLGALLTQLLDAGPQRHLQELGRKPGFQWDFSKRQKRK